MVRSLWIGPVLTVLAVTGLAWSQVLPPGSTPSSPKDKTMTIQETDKPALKCKVLKLWHDADGNQAFQVQAVVSGEMITIVQTGASADDKGKATGTKIYHWGDSTECPAGTPAAPADATVLGAPNGVEFPRVPYPPKTPGDTPKVAAPGQKWPSAFDPDATDVKPANAMPPAPVAGKRTPTETIPAAPDKVWPSAFAPEDTSPKPAMPVQLSGLEVKSGPALDPTAPGMPVQIKGTDTKKPAVGQATGPKSVVTEVVRTGNKVTTPGGVTYVPSVNAGSKVVVEVPDNAKPIVEPNTTEFAAADDKADATKLPDWHQSWGNAGPAPVVAKKADPPKVETPKKVEVPVPAEVRPVVKADPPKAETPKKVETAKKTDLPHADTNKVDPLLQPDRYTKVPGVDSKPIQVVKNTTPDTQGSTPKPVDTVPAAPLGMGSVAAAKMVDATVTPPAPVDKKGTVAKAPPYMPFEGGNAFSPPQPASPAQNPAAPPTTTPAVAPASFAQSNPTPPMMSPAFQPPSVQIPMDRGVSRGMTNAFTTGGTTRPIPADFGQPSQGGNAFTASNSADPKVLHQPTPPTDYNGANTVPVLMDRRPGVAPVQQVPVAVDPSAAAATNAPQLLAVLRDSLYPSQREWAADSLASQRSSKSQPQVVAGLISAAKDDPAPTVRAGCVRAIAQLQINTAPAVTLVQSLKNDPDPRVRLEAEQALSALTGNPTSVDGTVRPVSGH